MPIEILDKVEGKNYKYYCVENNRMKIVDFGCIPYKNPEIAPTILSRKESKTYEIITNAYADFSENLDGFIKYQKMISLLKRLYSISEGLTVDEAIDNLRKNIKSFQGKKVEEQLRPQLGVFVGSSKPIVRRYSDNDNSKTFDIVDIDLYTIRMSKGEKIKFYNKEREAISRYVSQLINNDSGFKKYKVPAGFLRLDHGSVTSSGYHLTFIIKEI